MQWKDRNGCTVPGDDGQDRLLETLYGTAPGRLVVQMMIRPWVSRTAGFFLNRRLSALAVKPFIRKHGIDMSDFENRRFLSFNDFFTRKIRPGSRPIDSDPRHLISPCDSKLTVYEIQEDSRFRIKNSDYTLSSLLRDSALADHYQGGTLLLFRLTVGDYHRYCFPDSGRIETPVSIPGVFHTVNPAASARYPIYKENTREYTLLQSDHFGQMLLMEVGATMVGRIVNDPVGPEVIRGAEKGRFEFGGSTILMLLEKGRAVLDPDLIKNTTEDVETVVKMGERIGEAL